jgi:hypothetical protein
MCQPLQSGRPVPKQEGWMTFTFKLERLDGTQPTRRRTGRPSTGGARRPDPDHADRTLQVVRIRDDDADQAPVLVVEDCPKERVAPSADVSLVREGRAAWLTDRRVRIATRPSDGRFAQRGHDHSEPARRRRGTLPRATERGRPLGSRRTPRDCAQRTRTFALPWRGQARGRAWPEFRAPCRRRGSLLDVSGSSLQAAVGKFGLGPAPASMNAVSAGFGWASPSRLLLVSSPTGSSVEIYGASGPSRTRLSSWPWFFVRARTAQVSSRSDSP